MRQCRNGANVVESVDRLLGRARTQHEQGHLVEAELAYQQLLNLDPDHADALHGLGLVRFQQNRTDEAESLLQRSIGNGPVALVLANHASVLMALGRQDEALAQLDAALKVNPEHLRSLFLRAGMLSDKGRYVAALADCDHALEKHAPRIEILCKRAAVLAALHRYEEALDSCDRGLTIDRHSFEAFKQRGDVLRQCGRFGDAVEAYARALTISPDSYEALLEQGRVLLEMGRLDSALESFNGAIALHPNRPEALYASSLALERMRRYAQALARCERTLALVPNHVNALANRGNALAGLARYAEALDSYDASLALNTEVPETLCNRAEVLESLNRRLDALESCRRAIECDDTYIPAWMAQGRVLQRLDRYEEALACFDRVLEIEQPSTEAMFQRGNTLRVMMRHDEALEAYNRVLDTDPGNIPAHFSKAFVFLTLGEFRKGWPEYEWRWKESQVGKSKRNYAQPLWLGDEPVEGRTVLLHAEQGLGDTIHFCRYASRVKALGAKVILEVQPALKTLLAEVEGVEEVVALGDPLPPFDLHCPLLSMGLVFQTEVKSIPSDVPYLQADPVRISKWTRKLGPGSRPRVGIVWSGNPKHLGDHARSIPFSSLVPLLSDAFEWVSLQKVIREEEEPLVLNSTVRHFGDDIADFSDTAALVELMDLVISVDTSVAHLAGALNRPLWVLIPYLPDWRWLLERDDSPWYPSARLFRQPRAGEWNEVFERVRSELQGLEALAAVMR